jgi:hypothetical protein
MSRILTAVPGREIFNNGHEIRQDPHGDGLCCPVCGGYWGINFLMKELNVDLGPCKRTIVSVPRSYNRRS